MKTATEIEALYTANMGTNHGAALNAVYQAGANDARADDAKVTSATATFRGETVTASRQSDFNRTAGIEPKDPLAHLRGNLKAKSQPSSRK